MKLEWFRTHKNFVYYLLLPVVGGGMAFYGVLSLFERGKFLGGSDGPAIRFTVGNKEYYYPPSEVIRLRTELTHINRRGNDVSTAEAGFHLVATKMGEAYGYAVGDEEIKDRVRDAVKMQVMQQEGAEANIAVNREVYHKLLTQLSLTPQQFERLTRDSGVMDKLLDTIRAQSKASDPGLFISYIKDKETVRARYQEIKSEDFMSKAKEPTEDEIKKFYEDNKDKPNALKDMFTKATMAADLFVLDPKKVESEVQAPKEEELKSFYERRKGIWVETDPNPPPTTPNAPQPERKYKPYETVKAEVEKEWRKEELRRKVNARMSTLKIEIETAEKVHTAAEAAKAEADRKPFDVAKWAVDKGLKHWSTAEQDEEKYKNGKREVDAPDAGWVGSLFNFLRDTPDATTRERNQKSLREMSFPQPVDSAAPEKGMLMYRMKSYTESKIKPMDAAKPIIVERLKAQEATKLASEDAKRIQGEWTEGKNIPALDTLEEITEDSKSTNPLLQRYFVEPKPVGQVLEVAQGPKMKYPLANMTVAPGAKVNMVPDYDSPHRRFYVGFAVERKTPKYSEFLADTTWLKDKGETERDQRKQGDMQALLTVLEKQFKELPKQEGDLTEPSLREAFQRGAPVDY